jgi:GNAT superfamily N-acetyltransferase
MNIFKTRQLTDKQFAQINQLWNDEFPVKLANRFPILLEGVENYSHYLVEDAQQQVMAWAVDFEKDQQVRFSIIVAKKHQGKGLGGLLIDRLKAANNTLYGWVIDHDADLKSNGKSYQSPMSFYVKHGFEILNDHRIDNEMIRAVLIKYSTEQ